MSACGGAITGVTGTGQAKTLNKAWLKAFQHLVLNGQQNCAGNSCDTGTCTFGLTAVTAVSDPIEVGNQVRITVTGDGACFCQ